MLLCSDEEMTVGFSGFGGREAAGTLGRQWFKVSQAMDFASPEHPGDKLN